MPKFNLSIVKKIFMILIFLVNCCLAQEKKFVSGSVSSEKKAIPDATIVILGTDYKTKTDSLGNYTLGNIPEGAYKIQIIADRFQTFRKNILVKKNENTIVDFELSNTENQLNEVVVSGTLKAVKRLESAVPVEVYSPIFFKKNPTASIYEALQNVNGVRPQLNCGVCNTGDIHINGLEGPYTLFLIFWMNFLFSFFCL